MEALGRAAARTNPDCLWRLQRVPFDNLLAPGGVRDREIRVPKAPHEAVQRSVRRARYMPESGESRDRS
jgi:hypothetical protein